MVDQREMIEALLQAERLLVHGLVDQAEQIYANAFDQDPRNAIAVVGLARVALARGDDRLAFARAREALEIDPYNVAAQRLEARLAEVLAARDEQGQGLPAAPPASPAPTGSPETQPGPPPAPEVRPSEQAFLTRNPSMADHRQIEQQRQVPRASPREDRAPLELPPAGERKPGLWRRLRGE